MRSASHPCDISQSATSYTKRREARRLRMGADKRAKRKGGGGGQPLLSASQKFALKNKRDSLLKETGMPQTVTDSILHMSSIISIQDSIIDQQENTINTQDTQIVQLNKALNNKDNVINLLTLSRDSLQKVVINRHIFNNRIWLYKMSKFNYNQKLQINTVLSAFCTFQKFCFCSK